ncbi:MAG: nucleoside hydrolase [Clostridia bacterium]|nr:nucleoside hydrolase [Clostridia bacterium]
MTREQFFNNLDVPTGKVDVVLDTDAYNEIDDQFAICYMLKKVDKLNVKGICAAPFTNGRAATPKEGMEKSYDEILRLLTFMGREDFIPFVHKGSEQYLPNESTPVESDAANFMAELANQYSPENPLYIVAIGAITNVASAILKNPQMKENCVLIWLGGHALHHPWSATEFNMKQDIAGARIVFGCQIPFIQLPCKGIVDHFATSKPELAYWIKGKNPLCDYLYESTVKEADAYAKDRPWTRAIWDVTAVAWLLNDNNRFMEDTLIRSPIPEYDRRYASHPNRHFIKYVYEIKRDALFEDLFLTLGE